MSRDAPGGARPGARRAAMVALVLALLAGLVWKTRDEPPIEARPIERATETPDAIVAPDAGPLEAITALAPVVREDAPVVVRSRAAPSTDVDPCARDEDATALVRASIGDVIDARTGELVARVRALGPESSPALREGIAALADHPEEAITRLESAPDRAEGAFDHAASAALYAGVRSLREERRTEGRRFAERASRLAPHDPAGPLLEAMIAIQDQDRARAREALGRAYQRDDEDPAIAWALGVQLARSDRPGDALPVLDGYLAATPDDAGARRLRGRIAIHAGAVRDAVRRERRGVILLAPRELESTIADSMLATIDAALTEAARWTGTERAGELVVIVHRDRDAMRAATCTPSWTGAVFDGALHTDLETVRGPLENARTMLRHETLHAQLHLSPGGAQRALPYWLDEGMAQRFAGDAGEAEQRSWGVLVRSRMWIPFSSIEGAFVEIDDPRDARLAYHQSLAMVRYLEARRGPRAIADAIAAVDRGVSPEALLAEIAPELDGPRLLEVLAAQPASE